MQARAWQRIGRPGYRVHEPMPGAVVEAVEQHGISHTATQKQGSAADAPAARRDRHHAGHAVLGPVPCFF